MSRIGFEGRVCEVEPVTLNDKEKRLNREGLEDLLAQLLEEAQERGVPLDEKPRIMALSPEAQIQELRKRLAAYDQTEAAGSSNGRPSVRILRTESIPPEERTK